MDAYEATKIVFSRIQNLNPENAAKIMGLLLMQDHGEKEMIRLAFGPETLLHSVVLKVCQHLGLLFSSEQLMDEQKLQEKLYFFKEGGETLHLSNSSSDLSSGYGWRPCLYFAKGFCKNGNTCRFLHEDFTTEQEFFLRSNSSKLLAYPQTASFPAKNVNFVLQNQNDGQRVLMGRSRPDFAGMYNPVSRQIYLTFPADSTFCEEDVSNYFSIYGPVQDVRIPYQQKRMFGFVTFVYPGTVKLILAKGNPHFVCEARVLVKPYKEKGKVLDKKQQVQTDRLDFSSCWTSTGLDSPLDIGGRMVYNIGNGGVVSQDTSLMRRHLEEQQQAELLQRAIKLQGRRFQLLDLKPQNFSAVSAPTTIAQTPLTEIFPSYSNGIKSTIAIQEDDINNSIGCSTEIQQQQSVNNNSVNKVESAEEPSSKDNIDFSVCTKHNLPDSPFASPTKASSLSSDICFSSTFVGGGVSGTNRLIGASPLPPCFFQMPERLSSDHGAVGM